MRLPAIRLPVADAPLPAPRAAARGASMETELWPNLVRAAARAGVRLLLVNARLSTRSARGYGGCAVLTRSVLRGVRRSRRRAKPMRRDCAAWARCGGDGQPQIRPRTAARSARTGAAWHAQWGPARSGLRRARATARRRRCCAHSPRPPANVLLVLVPRHPQRFDEVAALVGARAEPAAAQRDRDAVRARKFGSGWATAWARCSPITQRDCALIGGSLLPYGGQNLIEARAVGCPVLLGPHTRISTGSEERDAARHCACRMPANGLRAALMPMACAAEMGEAGRAIARVARAHGGEAGAGPFAAERHRWSICGAGGERLTFGACS